MFPASSSQGRTAMSLRPAQKRRPCLHKDSGNFPGNRFERTPAAAASLQTPGRCQSLGSAGLFVARAHKCNINNLMGLC